jgi:prolipoprotein diacylglyceryl transferase
MLGFSLKYKLRYLEILDRMAMPSAVGAAAVRLGNFFNSEIVGRPTDLPWAVDFVRYDRMMGLPPTCRHPSQLYEFALGMTVLGSLYIADRVAGREKRPLGLLAGLFLVLYFTGRFFVEFVKEYQTLSGNESFLTMGQYLSIIPVAAGIILLIWVAKTRIPTELGQAERLARVINPPPEEPAKTVAKTGSQHKKSGKKSRKKRKK